MQNTQTRRLPVKSTVSHLLAIGGMMPQNLSLVFWKTAAVSHTVVRLTFLPCFSFRTHHPQLLVSEL